jgi:hypothetical protein
MLKPKIINLMPPQFCEENIKEKIICIRSHRERIFRVESESCGNKLIFHNYGQGGAGWTFLFGCVNKSIKQFEFEISKNPEFKDKPICIIGAGCYGLLTAIILTREGYNVQILAKNLENIPSNKAAGFFFPRPRKCSDPEEIAIFRATGFESYSTYLQIIKNEHPFIKKGPKLLPAYFGLDIDPGFIPYINEGLIVEPEKVMINFGNDKIYPANEYKTIFINSSEIMHELWRNIKELDIKVSEAEINSFDEISESIIFNCSGYGAKKLADDKRIVPVQGHLITLQNQPDLANLQYMINFKVTMTNALGMPRDELIYYAPKESGILGITFLRGQDSLTSNLHEFDRLLQRCRDFFG